MKFGLIFYICILIFCVSSEDLTVSETTQNTLSNDERQLSTIYYNFPSQELYALWDLYNTTHGKNWVWKSGAEGAVWDFTQPNPNPCTEKWQGIVCTSDCTTVPCHVYRLVLIKRKLIGPVPSSLTNLTYLNRLVLSKNFLRGTLPEEFGSFQHLEVMQFVGNLLTGTIPASLGNLKPLKELVLALNNFRGTVPPEIFQIHSLTYINLNHNKLTGPIPSNVSALGNVVDFYMDHNELTGTIPPQLGDMKNVIHLGVWSNHLTGPIPKELGKLRRMREIEIDLNHLTGTIPPELGELESVTIFYLQENLLTGTIPSSLGLINKCNLFGLSSNLLSGTVPEELGYLPDVYGFYLFSNRLTGTVPPSLAYLVNILSFSVYDNQFTGTIPSTFGYQHEGWSALQMYNNFLTGSIPDGVGNLQYIRFFTLYNNFLTGTLPKNISTYHILGYVDVSRNILSGTIGGLFNTGTRVTALLLSNNAFTGNLYNFVGPDNTILQEFDVSTNHLTGTIPPQLFDYPGLNFVIMGVNCFTGTIPDSICHATKLYTVVLDGMHSSSSCKFKTIFKTYVIAKSIDGTVPQCLFNLTNLQLLHMSGNSLTGTLSVGERIPPLLNDLSLSHNFLRGTIPEILLQHTGFETLDLSFNAFMGTIPNSVRSPGDDNFYLQANRLSGNIPSALDNATNINILDGNLFNCDFNKASLPRNDPNYNSYTCGSDSMYTSLIFWLANIVIIGPLLFFVIRTRMPMKEVAWFLSWDVYKESNTALKDLQLTHITAFAWNVDKLLKLLYVVVAIAVVIIMPIYAILTEYCGTMTEQYVWNVAMSYLTGYPAALTMFFIFLILMTGLILQSTMLYQKPREDEITTRYYLYKYDTWQMLAFILWVGVVDIVLITTVNGIYVEALGVGLNNTLLTVIAIALSVFKLVWTNWVIIGYFGDRLARVHNTLFSEGFRAKYLLALSIYNNIIGPYLAEAFVSSNCFYYLVSPAPTVSSSFKLLTCFEEERTKLMFTFCSFNQTESLDFAPPFQYSYECSSSVLTSFAYIFVYRYLISGIVVPTAIFLLRYYEEILRKEGKTTENSELYAWIVWCLPFLLRPDIRKANRKIPVRTIIPRNIEDSGMSDLRGSDLLSIANIDDWEIPEEGFTAPPPLPGEESPRNSMNKSKRRTISQTRDGRTISQARDGSMTGDRRSSLNEELLVPSRSRLITVDQSVDRREYEHKLNEAMIEQSLTAGRYNNTYFIVSIVGDFGVLMTFGILFPPLAFIVAISIYVEIMLMEGMIGRLVQLAVDDKDLRTLVMAMNEEFQNMNQIVWSAMDWVYIITALFWAYSLFDTLGDSVGVVKAWWIAFVMGTSPLWLKAFFVTLKRYYFNKWENLNIEINSRDEKDSSSRFTWFNMSMVNLGKPQDSSMRQTQGESIIK